MHQSVSVLKALLLIVVMLGMLALLGMVVAGFDGVLFSLVMGSLLLFLYPSADPKLVAGMFHARALSRNELPTLYTYLDELAKRAGLDAAPTLYLLPSTTMTAFSTRITRSMLSGRSG